MYTYGLKLGVMLYKYDMFMQHVNHFLLNNIFTVLTLTVKPFHVAGLCLFNQIN